MSKLGNCIMGSHYSFFAQKNEIRSHIDKVQESIDEMRRELNSIYLDYQKTNLNFLAPELIVYFENQMKTLDLTIGEQTKSLNTLILISHNKEVEQDDIEHLIKHPNFACYKDYPYVKDDKPEFGVN
jgi:hypothetical protein